METQFLQISKPNAIKAFRGANPEIQAVLLNLFGDDVLSDEVIDRVKSYEDACAELGIPMLTINDFHALPQEDQPASFAYHQLTIITRALNEGWIADYSNNDHYKHYPWFEWKPGSSAFSFIGSDSDREISQVGSALSFISRERADYAGKQFIDIYNQFLSSK